MSQSIASPSSKHPNIPNTPRHQTGPQIAARSADSWLLGRPSLQKTHFRHRLFSAVVASWTLACSSARLRLGSGSDINWSWVGFGSIHTGSNPTRMSLGQPIAQTTHPKTHADWIMGTPFTHIMHVPIFYTTFSRRNDLREHSILPVTWTQRVTHTHVGLMLSTHMRVGTKPTQRKPSHPGRPYSIESSDQALNPGSLPRIRDSFPSARCLTPT